MRHSLFSFLGVPHKTTDTVEIMYFGRPSEFLMITSERMVIPDERHTLGRVLDSLRKRGDRWAHELDDEHVVCAINGKAAVLSDTLEVGDEIDIFSRKASFDP